MHILYYGFTQLTIITPVCIAMVTVLDKNTPKKYIYYGAAYCNLLYIYRTLFSLINFDK